MYDFLQKGKKGETEREKHLHTDTDTNKIMNDISQPQSYVFYTTGTPDPTRKIFEKKVFKWLTRSRHDRLLVD